MPSEGANATLPFVAANAVFRPKEFTTAITTWATVPYCTTDFTPYGNTAIDHLKQTHTVANIKIGIGDICRYMGGGWRIPTAAEWAELYGSTEQDKGQSVKLGNGWVVGNYYPLSGCAMGAGRASVNITGNDTNTQVFNADPWINGAIFLPANGHRNTDGAIWWIGSGGFYWSSTTSTIDLGYKIQFSSSTVNPKNGASRAYAHSIRCIRE